MLKYSLLHLLTVLLLAGVAAAALTRASSTWECVVLTSTLVALAASVVAALFRRPFAIGFAVFGWVYLLLLYAPWFSDLRPKLLTTWSVDWLFGKVQRPVAQPRASAVAEVYQDVTARATNDWVPIGSTAANRNVRNWEIALNEYRRALAGNPQPTDPPYQAFASIGQAIWLWLIAYLGGWCACVVHVLSSRTTTGAGAAGGEKSAVAVETR
jgi:hypothetical protein